MDESHTADAPLCHLHRQYTEQYDSLKCLELTCTSMQSSCNGISSGANGSDVLGGNASQDSEVDEVEENVPWSVLGGTFGL